MSELEEYASYLDEDYDQELQELHAKYFDGHIQIDIDDDNYNDPRQTIEKEVALWTIQKISQTIYR